jgi:hypothetical protein
VEECGATMDKLNDDHFEERDPWDVLDDLRVACKSRDK